MRVYATEKTGRKHLVAVQCDGCEARIKPNPDIGKSGWVRRGVYYGPGDEQNTDWDLCPVCADRP